MSTEDYPLNPEEFDAIYSKVPRLTVEVIVKNTDGAIHLTKRAIEPFKDHWHLPGGTVFFGEHLTEAVRRVAQRELGIEVHTMKHIGYIEYPSHFLNGLDCPVGIAFEVTDYTGDFIMNEEASEGSWFTEVPKPMHPEQDEYLVEKGYLKATV